MCEQLPPDVCAFAVSSGGRRCVLESTPEGAHRCQTSAVAVRALSGWVETDGCVRACGVDRAALGLPVASAAADDRRFVRALCSPACYGGCPNIVDLYATLAAGEGASQRLIMQTCTDRRYPVLLTLCMPALTFLSM